jgi:hypothetical protein
MKLFYAIYLISAIVQVSCTSLEKERLDLDRERLEFDKAKLLFEQEKSKSCCCPTCNETCKGNEIAKSELFVEKKKTSDCGAFPSSELKDIWTISIEGEWYYSPQSVKQGILCKSDQKEFFYKQFSNTDSYVAETQVPATKRSSCINNVLFSGKPLLYASMIEKTAARNDVAKFDKKVVLEKVIEYNTAEKGRSFYYECVATDKLKRFDSCKCVLYTSYPKGEEGVLELLRK